MKFVETKLKGAYIVKPKPFEDDRGSFTRLFCQKEFQSISFDKNVNQINHSFTVKKGTVRGMHFQLPPHSEAKLVKCLKGEIFDVMIDLRKDSATFLKWHGEVLNESNIKMLYIPEGFAHGFQTLDENCELLYFHTGFYNHEHEGGLRYDDARVDIQWPIEVTEVSDRDKSHSLLNAAFPGIVL